MSLEYEFYIGQPPERLEALSIEELEEMLRELLLTAKMYDGSTVTEARLMEHVEARLEFLKRK
jgi:hypothetical protein